MRFSLQRPTRTTSLLAAAAVGLSLLVGIPGTEADASTTGCMPAGGADQPFTTPQTLIDQGDDIVVNGGGWGHGLGMSQYGARGAGILGCNHQQILTTYFPGTEVGSTPAVPKVRVGLVQKGTYADLTAESGPVTWKLTDCQNDATCAGQPALPTQPKGAIWRITSKADGTFVITQRNGFPEPTVVWEGGDLYSLLLAQHEGTVIKTTLQGDSSRPYRRTRYGYTEFDSFASEGGRIYSVQNITPSPDGSIGAMERYLFGLAEVPLSWPYETLKAQAVAGRSYAAIRVGLGDRAACRCQIYATTRDQHWTGQDNEEAGSASQEWIRAVKASAGVVLKYGSKIADTFYSSSHGGSSDNSEHVWGTAIPYVKAVDTSRWETVKGVNNSRQRWSVGYTYEELAARFGMATFRDIQVITRGPGGHPTVKDLNGDGSPDGVRIRGYAKDGTPITLWRSGEQLRSSSRGLGIYSSLVHIDVINPPGVEPSPTPSPTASPTPSPSPTSGERTGPTIDLACPADETPEDDFSDLPENDVHEHAVDCIIWWQVAAGRTDGTYDPSGDVTRDQMATFIANALRESGFTLPTDAPDAFSDDNGNTHEANINALAAAGIVNGTRADTYSPRRPVNRAQMATFLIEAFEAARGSEAARGPNHFTDDEGNTHEASIDKARTAWIATGKSDTLYAPAAHVTRGQMGSFLARMLDALVSEGHAAPPSARPQPSPSASPSASPSPEPSASPTS